MDKSTQSLPAVQPDLPTVKTIPPPADSVPYPVYLDALTNWASALMCAALIPAALLGMML